MFRLSIIVFCLSIFFCSFAHASDERYTIEIKVDVTDQNASVAREKAMSSASRAAIVAVAKRISTPEGAAKIAEMTDAQLINFVKETSVLNERNSDIRYMADLKILVNEELLKQYMIERGISLSNQPIATSVLIVPIFREFTDDTPLLWESSNLWKQAWENHQQTSAINFITIANSAGFISAIDAEQAAATDSERLEKLAEMSGANDVYVLDATYNGIEGLKIMATSLSGERFEIDVAGAKSSGANLFNQAVIESRHHIEQKVFESKNTIATQEEELTVLYPFSSLNQWIAAEQKIKSLNIINKIDVQAMAPGKAQFKIFYTGSLSNLKHLLQSQGYQLKDGGNYMILSNIGVQ